MAMIMVPVTDESAGEERSNFEPRHSREEHDCLGSNVLGLVKRTETQTETSHPGSDD